MSFGALELSEEDMKAYGRLDVARRDLYDCMAYGDFIIKKGWNAKPWSRGSVYLQQTAFVTAMVVSYGRAFTRSDGFGYLPKSMMADFSPEEQVYHKQIMDSRHQLYAHSDSAYYPIKPYRSPHMSDITQYHVEEISADRIRQLQAMCRKVIDACTAAKEVIKEKY